MITRRQALTRVAAATGLIPALRAKSTDEVALIRVPDGGLQPQTVVTPDGAIHLLYYNGDPLKGNLFYTRQSAKSNAFSAPIQVNSQEGSAIALGTIRGGQLAVTASGHVHVAWNGSGVAVPGGPVNPDSGKPGAPMLYSRLKQRGTAFEPQRNLMHHSFGLDGGGSVAADAHGNVYVAWHGVGESEAKGTGREGEARRRVWITKSADNGASFSPEHMAWSEQTGACGCCGLKLFTSSGGDVYALYRSATESIHRDIYLLRSRDGGRTFQGRLLDKWEVNACPMSSMDFAEGPGFVATAWETGGQIYWTRVAGSGDPAEPVAAPGQGKGRKHPRLAINRNGKVLLVWTEGTGFRRGGDLAYQMYARTGQPSGDVRQIPGIPAFSFAAALARADGEFAILY